MGRPVFTAPVERPSDRAARTDDFNNKKGNTQDILSGNNTTIGATNDTNEVRYLVQLSVAKTTDGGNEGIRVAYSVRDGTGATSWRAQANLPDAGMFPPEVPIPANGEVVIDVLNKSANTIRVDWSVTHRGGV